MPRSRSESAAGMVPSEHEEQVQFVRMVEAAYPAVSALLFAIPNGTHKSPAARVRFRSEGLRSGIPDLFLAVPAGSSHGLFIEMKRRKGGVISPEQKEYIEALREQGYSAHVCHGCDEAFAVFDGYLNGTAAKHSRTDK